jgi:hypothetical protein
MCPYSSVLSRRTPPRSLARAQPACNFTLKRMREWISLSGSFAFSNTNDLSVRNRSNTAGIPGTGDRFAEPSCGLACGGFVGFRIERNVGNKGLPGLGSASPPLAAGESGGVAGSNAPDNNSTGMSLLRGSFTRAWRAAHPGSGISRRCHRLKGRLEVSEQSSWMSACKGARESRMALRTVAGWSRLTGVLYDCTPRMRSGRL